MQIYQLENTLTLQQHLAQRYQVYQLISNLDGDSHWQVSDPAKEVPLTAPQSISSPKSLFFAERENLFSFDGECFRETVPIPAPFALLGVHSCDLTAIAYQDQFFADDPYYQARRQQALLIGIDCTSPCEQGFCHTVNAGPGVAADCADIILHRQSSGQWLVLVCTDRGEQAAAGLNLALADNNGLQHRQQQLDSCIRQFDDHSHIRDGVQQLLNGDIDDSFWQQVGIQCLSCSGCTSLCPTCSCYGSRDQLGDDGTIYQQRFWDSCLYESFQREASQHNPSQQAGARVRRFWTHKFSNATVEEFGRHGCVGCGRCEQTCPGVIGAHSMMKRIVAHKKPNKDKEPNKEESGLC